VRVATRQTRNNEERLRVEFFDKRFGIWKAANDAVRQEVERITALTEDDLLSGNVGGAIMDRFYDSKREALYLFGPEAIQSYTELESAIVSYFVARKAFARSTQEPPSLNSGLINTAAQSMGEAREAVTARQQSLMQAVAPYLDLSHIAVLPPNRRRRVGWRVGRLSR
jgi:hypothetical protein